MVTWKTDRVTIFLGIVFVFFLWDLAYFLGLRDPNTLPHLFVLFRKLGDVELLHGFPSMLRQVILTFVLGGLFGIGAGYFIRRSTRLAQTSMQVLRLGRWLPFLIVFTIPDPWDLGIAAAILGSCYYYLVAKSILQLGSAETRSFVMGETVLPILLFSLLSQIWLAPWKRGWNWFLFAEIFQVLDGFAVFCIVVAFLVVIRWIFRSEFRSVAQTQGRIFCEELKIANWKWLCGFLLFTLAFAVIWERVGYMIFTRWSGSPLGAISMGYEMLFHSEIYQDIMVSLLELLGGIVLGGSVATFVFALISANNTINRTVASLLPLSNISLIVVWLLSFLTLGRIVPNFLFWQKVVAVACLVFFPFVQALWGFRKSSFASRILIATDYALPLGFIAMLFGELWAATAGLGFSMVVWGATYQNDKGFAVFIITVALLV